MSKAAENLFYQMIDKERNIYEKAQLFEQNRREVKDYIYLLEDPKTKAPLRLSEDGNTLIGSEKYDLKNNVSKFTSDSNTGEEWKKLNEQFLNYHKSLSVYTAINSMPIFNYLAIKSRFGFIDKGKVLDIGGGTGQTYCSFFLYPEKIEYFLLDPNVRLLHDQFLRIFPKLSLLKIAHIQANAEYLPIVDNSFEYVISLSAVDHFNDFKKFIQESFRVLKKGGKFLLSSHLDKPESEEDRTKTNKKIFSSTFLERLTRFLYFRKYAVGTDDHTLHLENTSILEEEMVKAGFKIIDSSEYKRHFYIVGLKE